jgi:hypothetical protein
MAKCECNDVTAWDAWLDKMPSKSPTLHVIGTCTCPTPGFLLSLRPREPQGANPKDLLLDVIEVAPSEAQPEVVTPVSVEYVAPTSLDYETVSIPDGGPLSIPVRPVS